MSQRVSPAAVGLGDALPIVGEVRSDIVVGEVDSARVKVVQDAFFDPPLRYDLLVLTVDFAISKGFFNRIAYQVTVLAPTQTGFDYDTNVEHLGDGDQPN